MLWTLVLAAALLLTGIFGKIELLMALGWLLLAGWLISRLWLWWAVKQLYFVRTLPASAHTGDIVKVELAVNNRGILPLPWLTVRDFYPPDMETTPRTNWLLGVRGREKISLNFEVKCKKRGRYLVGPLESAAGVALDTETTAQGKLRLWQARSRMVVYPALVSLERLGLPSRVSLGNLRTNQHLLPDPSRVAGVRDYQPGDDPRHIDWRNSARVGELQVKVFERTRQIPLAIFLDLHLSDYNYDRRLSGEAAIVVAASLAYRAQQLNQPFGLFSNGFDPGWDNIKPNFDAPGPERPPRQGEAWLTETLDTLAGIEMRAETLPLEKLLGKWTSKLPWGATIAVVGCEPNPDLVSELLRLRKVGFSPLAIFTGKRMHDYATFKQVDALKSLNIQVYDINHPMELVV